MPNEIPTVPRRYRFVVCVFKWLYRKWTEKHSYAVYFGEGDDQVNVGAGLKPGEEVESANLRFAVDSTHVQSPHSDDEKSVLAIGEATDLDIGGSPYSPNSPTDPYGRGRGSRGSERETSI